MKSFLDRVLEYYDLTKEDYDELIKDVNLDNLPYFDAYKNIVECVNFIKKKVENKEKILIYGDYDCDGVISTSIIYLTLKNNDFIPGFYIPFREKDGYGLTKENVDKFYSLGYRTFILVDNGITLNEEIEYCNNLGIDVIILDHHMPENNLPKAKYILHPTVSGFSDYNMSAGTVCFYFSYAYLNKIDEYLLTLAGISTLSDLMPLKKINRIFVKLCLKMLNENRYLNIISLMENKIKYDENDLTMQFIPKINAIGRIINDNTIFNIVRFFNSYDNEFILNKYIDWINNTNDKRKDLLKEALNKEEYKEDGSSSIFIKTDINEGLIGLLSSKYMNDFNKPCVVITKSGEDSIYKGSIRSKNGFDVSIFLDKNKDLLINYGGHINAGGFTIKVDNVDDLKVRLEKAAQKYLFLDDEKYLEINLNEVNFENYNILYALAPFGMGFKPANILMSGISTKFLTFSKDNKHIITNISPLANITYFNFNKEIFNYKSIDLIGNMNINSFRGKDTIRFNVFKYKVRI